MNRALMVLVVATSGCASGCAGDGEPVDASPPPVSPYQPHPFAEPEPSFGPDEVGALAPQMVSTALRVAPEQLLAVYQAMLAHGDVECPGVTTFVEDGGEGSAWFLEEPCQSADGTWFSGEGYLATFSRPDEDGGTETGFELGVELLEITTPDGAYLAGSLAIYQSRIDFDGGRGHYVEIVSTLQADAATAAGHAWLDGSVTGSATLYAEQSGAESYLGVAGSLALSSWPGVTAVDFDELAVDGADCAIGLGGGLALRDGAGGWHELGFDDGASSCDTCGELTFLGAALGSFCADEGSVSALLAWGETPW